MPVIPTSSPRADMTNPSKYFLLQSLSTIIALQVALELASQMKPVCSPIHVWEDGDWCGVDTLPDYTLASTACQEQDFCLSWAMIPNLWVLGFLVLYLLSSHFSFVLFSLPPLELSFSNVDLIISLSCLTLLKVCWYSLGPAEHMPEFRRGLKGLEAPGPTAFQHHLQL